MLFKIKFISDEVDGFLSEIKIDSDATFLDLNRIILQACNYPDDQMTSFYICDDEWERGQQITREDMADAGQADEDLYTMADAVLSDFIEDEGQKMEYVFDPFAERVFYLEVKELIPGEHLDYPAVVRAKGNPPVQIEQIDLSAPTVPPAGNKGNDGLDGLDAADFYGDENFDSEDFDPEGYEISDGNSY